MLVIGLTGTIGSGKSTIASFMQEMGASVIDTDEVGHEIYLPHTFGWQKVVEAFGISILTPNKSIDRQKLGEIVFNDSAALKQLNDIVRPLILESVKDTLKQLRHKNTDVVVIEAALLLEASWESMMDEIWVTTAPENVLYERLSIKRHLTELQARQRIAAHLSTAQQIKYATRVINTDLSLNELKAVVSSLWREVNQKGT